MVAMSEQKTFYTQATQDLARITQVCVHTPLRKVGAGPSFRDDHCPLAQLLEGHLMDSCILSLGDLSTLLERRVQENSRDSLDEVSRSQAG